MAWTFALTDWLGVVVVVEAAAVAGFSKEDSAASKTNGSVPWTGLCATDSADVGRSLVLVTFA
jgi:hypothetical protein